MCQGTWEENHYTGTGFPGYSVGARVDVSRRGGDLRQGIELQRAFMINYNLYRHYFPMMAMGRARRYFRDRRARQILEYLSITDENNVTRPYLLESWQPSEDLKTWTLNVRRGVKFNNGDEFTADDVIFTLNQWLSKDVGSSLLGMVGGYLNPTGIEKTDKYQIKLHLNKAEIAVPEHMFHYPALILNHKTFEGDFIKRPHGTGPYTLEVYREGERCVLKRRSDYWQKGDDGKTLPYMDAMEFTDMGREMSPQIAAISDIIVDERCRMQQLNGCSQRHHLRDVLSSGSLMRQQDHLGPQSLAT